MPPSEPVSMSPGIRSQNTSSKIECEGPREVASANRFVDVAALFPEGLVRKIYRLVQPLVEYAFGFSDLWRLHAASVYAPFEPPLIASRTLKKLGIPLEIDAADLDEIAAIEGPIILAANHPFGGIDALAFIQFMELIRPGEWKLIANAMVCSFEGFATHCIALDPLGTDEKSRRANRVGLHAISAYLKQGGMIGIFPAARVSHRHKELNGNVVDRPWNKHFIRQAMRSGATIVCLHIPGQNSNFFLRIPPRWPKLRALFLARELTKPSVEKLKVQLAEIVPPNSVARLAASPQGPDQLRAASFLRADLDVPRPNLIASLESTSPLAEPPSSDDIIAELDAVTESGQGHLLDHNRFSVYFAQGRLIPKTLRALGCGRETTFRAAGQGTGKECDLSPEDDYYYHLLLWDRERARLAGAYRIGYVKRILEELGVRGLYLDHVFKIKPRFYELMGSSFELSRSYILPEYQGDPDALASLWKGIGASCLSFGIKTLFGCVTISNDHHPASRAILVEYLKANHADTSDMRAKVKARIPFQPATRYHRLVADAYRGQGIQKLAPVINKIENDERGIPPLLRYYCNLNARFVAFHVEADFGNSLYCLLRVELEKIPPGYLKRFMSAPMKT